MRVAVKCGNILDTPADALVCAADVHLDMAGGLAGELLARGATDAPAELEAHLARSGRLWLAPGSVVRTGAGPLPFAHLLHAVVIDAGYGSGVELVDRAVDRALAEAARLGASAVAIPALATGPGPLLSVEEFAEALGRAVARRPRPLAELRVVLPRPAEAEAVATILAGMLRARREARPRASARPAGAGAGLA